MKILGFAIGSGPLLTMLAVLAIALGLGWTFLAGAQGAAGSTGITTLDHTKHRGVVVEGNVGARGKLSVSCPAGQVTGGGFSHVGTNLQIIESRPDGINGWRVSWVQSSADDSVLHVYAICMVTGEQP